MGPIKMWKYERFQRSYPPFKWYMICDLWFKLQNCAFVPIYKVNIHIHKVSLQFLIIIKIPKNDEAQQNPKVVWKMCKPGNLENHFSNFGHTHLKHSAASQLSISCCWSSSILFLVRFNVMWTLLLLTSSWDCPISLAVHFLYTVSQK